MPIRFAFGAKRIATLIAMAVAISGCKTVTQPQPSWTIPQDASVEIVNGYPMAYATRGTGPIVVMVHGVLTDYRIWQPQLATWSSDFRVVAVSLRHFYPEKWSGKGDDFTATQHANDLIKFIETMHQPVYLVGWSYGAYVAYEVARTRPDLIRRLVLAEAPIDALVGPVDQVANAIQVQRANETAKFFKAGDIDGGLQFSVDAINGPGTWDKRPEPVRQTLRDNAWTVVGIGQQTPARVTCAEFGSLPMPVLLLTGELTTPRFRRIIQKESECLPAAPVVIIPKAGHPMAMMNPTAFKDAVTTFLKQ